ncbi:MAG: biotin--[acetyl-CoA-carboxylase] ligase [Bacteroidales bacterium]|nr:biotin--[acetyl-CoA-carboxylase] ligase [Bacteroidales bacterium]MCL2132814.1 biotin--[acetyl-CoA-carboxylase] ligase [Bacteroidales bacterium]
MKTIEPHSVTWLNTVDSTNSEAARHSATAADLEVWAAVFQQVGRGQQENRWESEAGKNLLFSIFLRPKLLLAEKQFLLSQLVSIALCDCLQKEGVKAVIKWPNDIYVNKKKIAGILIEHHISGAYISSSIAGIGLNVNQQVFHTAPNPTSMFLETKRLFDLPLLLQKIINNIKTYYLSIDAEKLQERYLSYLLNYKKWATYINSDGKIFKAKIIDVCSTGELSLINKMGDILHFAFKEISLCQ